MWFAAPQGGRALLGAARRGGLLAKHAALAQLGPQCQQHIKHDTHTGDGFALKRAAGLVGVDGGVGSGDLHGAIYQRGQVVIRDQHLQTQVLGCGYTGKTGDAVVNGYQQVCTAGLDALGDRRCQAITIHHTVGHDVTHALGPQHAQPAYRHSAGGGPVAVVISNNANRLVLGDGISQQRGSFGQAFHGGGGQQQCQAIVQFRFALHTACRVQTRQQRVHTGLFQRPGGTRRHLTHYQFHS